VGEVVKPSAQTLGYSMQKSLFPNVGHRVRAEDAVAESAVKEFGKQTGTYASGLLQGVVNSGINMGREAASWGPQRKKIFDQLMMSDPVISRADPEMVLQAYHSMKRFAPLLSTDPHAAQAFLREAVIHEGAMNYNTVGALAKAETEARRALGM
jgi:tellurite resistance protein